MTHFMKKQLKKIILAVNVLLLTAPMVMAQTAALLPNARQQYFDGQGNVLSRGSVGYYVPGTNTLKNIWLDSGEGIPAQNPQQLDENGYPEQTGQIYGDGIYRQVLKDKNEVPIWDNLTSSTGSGGGGGGTATVGDGDVVGTIKAYGGFLAPYGYVFSYGQELIRASFPEALAALTNQQTVSCTSGSATLTGFSSTDQFPIGAPVEGLCLNPGTTIVSKTPSTVTVSSTAITSSNTAITVFPFGNGNGSTTFNVPDLRGRVIAGRDTMGGISANRLTSSYFGNNGGALGGIGGDEKHTLTIGEIPSHAHGIFLNDPGHNHGGVAIASNRATDVQQGTSYLNVWNGTTTTTTGLSSTGITLWSAAGGTGTQNSTASVGGGSAHSIIQPTEIFNYIIKIIPDSNPNSFFGVASIGGMEGVIECGNGVICAGNTISLNQADVNDVTVVTSATYNVLPHTSAIAINRPSPSATTINLPSVASQNLIGIHIVDWSDPIPADHIITLVPNGTETIMRLSNWQLYSNSTSRSVVTLYPSPTLNGWYLQ